jgi:hypothetical protein
MIHGVGDDHGFVTFALGDGLLRRDHRLIKVAMEIGAGEVGQGEALPQHEILSV